VTSKHQSALVEKGNKKGFLIIKRADAHIFQACKRDRGAEQIYYIEREWNLKPVTMLESPGDPAVGATVQPMLVLMQRRPDVLAAEGGRGRPCSHIRASPFVLVDS
jgi:hypothetical protein